MQYEGNAYRAYEHEVEPEDEPRWTLKCWTFFWAGDPECASLTEEGGMLKLGGGISSH